MAYGGVSAVTSTKDSYSDSFHDTFTPMSRGDIRTSGISKERLWVPDLLGGEPEERRDCSRGGQVPSGWAGFQNVSSPQLKKMRFLLRQRENAGIPNPVA